MRAVVGPFHSPQGLGSVGCQISVYPRTSTRTSAVGRPTAGPQPFRPIVTSIFSVRIFAVSVATRSPREGTAAAASGCSSASATTSRRFRRHSAGRRRGSSAEQQRDGVSRLPPARSSAPASDSTGQARSGIPRPIAGGFRTRREAAAIVEMCRQHYTSPARALRPTGAMPATRPSSRWMRATRSTCPLAGNRS